MHLDTVTRLQFYRWLQDHEDFKTVMGYRSEDGHAFVKAQRNEDFMFVKTKCEKQFGKSYSWYAFDIRCGQECHAFHPVEPVQSEVHMGLQYTVRQTWHRHPPGVDRNTIPGNRNGQLVTRTWVVEKFSAWVHREEYGITDTYLHCSREPAIRKYNKQGELIDGVYWYRNRSVCLYKDIDPEIVKPSFDNLSEEDWSYICLATSLRQ